MFYKILSKGNEISQQIIYSRIALPNMKHVAIINCGIGNVQSLYNAVKRVSENAEIITDPNSILVSKFDRIILPGVGAVGRYLNKLREAGFERALKKKVVDERTPFLGICVGMQILATSCFEFGTHEAFNLIPGSVRKFPQNDTNFKIPHIGWNQIKIIQKDSALKDLNDEDFYFVHSYHYECEPNYIIASTEYGGQFPSIIGLGNVFGVQFHPEKSSSSGERLLDHFIQTGSLNC